MNNNHPKIITISGKARGGKNTLADFMKKELEFKGKKVAIIAYGDYVKLISTTLYDWNGEKDEQGRTILQRVGTDIARKQNEDFWVSIVDQTIKVFKEDFDYFLIPDARFVNEIEYFRKKGEYLISFYIERPDFKSDLTEEQLKHPSETSISKDYCDIYVENKGLDCLENYVKELFNEVV